MTQFGNFNPQNVKVMLDGRELENYQTFYQAKIKNNDMLLIKAVRSSNLQGPVAQRNINSNYLSNQPPAGDRFPWAAGNASANRSPPQTSNQKYGFFNFNEGPGSLSTNANSNYGVNRSAQQSGTSQNKLPVSELELAMQKEIEKKIHFDRMDRHL